MTPKEKAQELAEGFFKLFGGVNKIQDDFEWNKAKQCALICVDEIMNIKSVYHDETLSDYWNEVKQEIPNL